jgi:glucose dehydrogenase
MWRIHTFLALAMIMTGCIAGTNGPSVPGTTPATAAATPPPQVYEAPSYSRGDWPASGNDTGGTRDSPLTQIDRGNVGPLRVTWIYRTGAADDTS